MVDKQPDFVCPNDRAGQNYKSFPIKVYTCSWMTNPQWVRKRTRLLGGTASCFRVDVLQSSKIILIFYIIENEHSLFPNKNIVHH